MSAKVVVAGVGSEYRRDDGIGPAVAARVAACVPGATDIGPIAEPLDLLGRWDEAELAVVVDAVRSGAAPGSIRVVDLRTGDDLEHVRLPAATSTHGIGLIGALRIARATGGVPPRVVLVAIEGSDFTDGRGLSSAVEAATESAVAQVLELLAMSC